MLSIGTRTRVQREPRRWPDRRTSIPIDSRTGREAPLCGSPNSATVGAAMTGDSLSHGRVATSTASSRVEPKLTTRTVAAVGGERDLARERAGPDARHQRGPAPLRC
jgi:hypothetical protein